MKDLKIRPISEARFYELTYVRHPAIKYFAKEIEWYSDEEEALLGVILLDITDQDYVALVLERDERMIFHSISTTVNLESLELARNILSVKFQEIMAQRSNRSVEINTSIRLNKRKKKGGARDIFQSIVPESKLNPDFSMVMTHEAYSCARELIREIVYTYEDPDGNYIEQFQTTGFDARVWELYLYSYLHEEDFVILRNNNAPDYGCEKAGNTIYIEAVTVNPSGDSKSSPSPESPEDIAEALKDFMPIKFGSALYSKLTKRYWEKSHVRGNPLIFAIQDFHQSQSLLWSSTALSQYLYGVRHRSFRNEDGRLIIIPEQIERHKYGDKEIPSGFFRQPGAEYISAVLFSNSGTIAKFNRMGKLAGFGSEKVKMIRTGFAHDPNPDAAVPVAFSFEVEPDSYDETWSEGLSMYHNPYALYRIDKDLFPGIAHHCIYDGQIVSYLPAFYPYNSLTYIFVGVETLESNG